MSAKQQILANLNEQQKKPVLDYYGPSFVVACPGAGKTATTIARTAYMIECGVDPRNILIFTFTRKAANELKERVAAKIGDKAIGVTVGTYHSFCSRLLRKYCEYLGFETNFSIYDEDDKSKLLKSIVDKEKIDTKTVAYYISRWKDIMANPTKAAELAANEYEEYAAEYYAVYQAKLKEQNAFDFDDLVYMSVRLLQDHEIVRKQVNKKYQYIMADESQDSSDRDAALIMLLAGDKQNVCFIFDDDQSIYGFRGANMNAVLKYRDELNVKVFTLGQNYRSTKTIVNAARSLIAHNRINIEKTVFTANKEGEKIIYFEQPGTVEEATMAVKIIMALKKKEKLPASQIAVLYRMGFLSRAIEEALLKNGIAYNIVGGCPFYSRKEVKDVISYLRLLYNPHDVQAFRRIINTPKRGIGDKTVEKILDFANQSKSGIILLDACKKIQLKGTAKKGIEQFNAVMDQLRGVVDEDCKPAKAIQHVISLTRYDQFLVETESDADERYGNLTELMDIASQHESVADFLYSMALNTEVSDQETDETEKIQLLTMHASKGLEFSAVIIIGSNDGIIPHQRANTIVEIEEERRLFYVAMTRAKEYLFITRPRVMQVHGAPIHCKESRFIREVDDQYLLRAR